MNNEEKILEMLTQMQEDIHSINSRLDHVEDLAARTAVAQENVIQPAIDTLVEGQEITHQMLKELVSKDEVEDLRAEVAMLRTVSTSHRKRIEALEKAQ